jgi:hypothetical protein
MNSAASTVPRVTVGVATREELGVAVEKGCRTHHDASQMTMEAMTIIAW